MTESNVAVDSLALQRSLTLLEDRYRELRKIGQKHFESWEKETSDLQQQLSAQAHSLQQAQQASDQQAASLQTLEADLANLQLERDTLSSDKDSAQQTVADLQQQLSAQAHSLQENQEELELTLLQLHQVQEELEHYFLENQDIKRKAEEKIAFLRSQMDERETLIKQYQTIIEQLKGVTLKSLRPRPFYSRWVGTFRRIGLLPGVKPALLLPQGK